MRPQARLSRKRLTLEEWGNLPEDEPGEWIDGYLVEDEEVGALHDVVAAWLITVLGNWVSSRGGFVGTSDTRFAVSRTRGRKPDLYVYLSGQRPPAEGLVKVPPYIMVEVVSRRPKDARRDRIEKVDDYSAFGVKYYWIVEPAVRSLEIYELGKGRRYTRALSASEGQARKVPGCEGLALDLDELWARVDRLES